MEDGRWRGSAAFGAAGEKQTGWFGGRAEVVGADWAEAFLDSILNDPLAKARDCDDGRAGGEEQNEGQQAEFAAVDHHQRQCEGGGGAGEADAAMATGVSTRCKQPRKRRYCEKHQRDRIVIGFTIVAIGKPQPSNQDVWTFPVVVIIVVIVHVVHVDADAGTVGVSIHVMDGWIEFVDAQDEQWT